MSDKGMIHIYTGEGKGKTTAALGIALRAKSSNIKVLFVQFFKEKEFPNEVSLLEDLKISTLIFDNIKSPLFHPSVDRLHTRKETDKALACLKTLFAENAYDLVILDEFLCLISEGILSEGDALEFLKSKPENMELVLTGRGASDGIIAMADYVTYMQNIKHPYDLGIMARKGIES